jgi:acetyl esterase/lipase
VLDWDNCDPAALTAAYDNAGAVDGARTIVAGWAERSGRLRAKRPEALDMPYGVAPRMKWDVFPASDRSAPCLVFVHGGYWQMNGREGFSCMAEGALARGWSAALPGYSLAPEASMTKIVAEMGRALDFLADHRRLHDLDGPVILAGWSAGAHLCAMHACHPIVRATVLVSGIYDLRPIAGTGLNAALCLTDAEVRDLSPVRHGTPEVPMIIAYGADELPELRRQSVAFAAHCVEGGRSAVMTLPVKGANHFSVLDHLRDTDGEIMAIIDHMVGGMVSL